MQINLLQAKLFEDMDISDESVISSKFTERHVPKGQILFYQGDPGNEMYIIKSGALKIYRENSEREIVLGHQFSGEMIGELECIHYNNQRLASVAAMENSVLWMISKASLEDLISIYPQILRKILYVVSERLEQADRKLEYLAFMDARIRVVNLLLDLNANFGVKNVDGYLINWKITQSHFANMIGIGRESAARILLDLQHEEVITMKNKYITIHDLQTLQQLSDEQQHHFSDNRHWHST